MEQIIVAAIIVGGIAVMIAVTGFVVWAIYRESQHRPVLPWGARGRVDQAKAHTEVLEEGLKQDAIEVKRLAIEYHRQQVMKAMEEEDTEKVRALGLPSPEPPRYQQQSQNNY